VSVQCHLPVIGWCFIAVFRRWPSRWSVSSAGCWYPAQRHPWLLLLHHGSYILHRLGPWCRRIQVNGFAARCYVLGMP
jgi:hypothetical protein